MEVNVYFELDMGKSTLNTKPTECYQILTCELPRAISVHLKLFVPRSPSHGAGKLGRSIYVTPM